MPKPPMPPPTEEAPRVLPDDEHNRTLVANAHPADWTHPQPAPRYNLVVIGAGTAGLVAAAGAAGLGARVALIERHLMGGDCLNVGCVPSKAVIRAGRVRALVRDAGAFGTRVPEGVRLDFPAVMERMRRLRAGISPNDSAARFRGFGVDVFLGEGRFLAPDRVRVGESVLRFRKACIATGARAGAPDIPGLAEAGYLTNETLFSLTELPPTLAVLGSGPIGCEMAQAFARFGSRVHLIEIGPRILPREDPKAAARLLRSFERDGVELHLDTRLEGVESGPTGKVLRLTRAGSSERITADEILVGIGRVPNVEGLGLEEAGVEYDRRTGVHVDDRLRTTNRRIFAAGDIASRYKFTHAADFLARIVIQNALFFGRARASALTIPWCTYTDPEIAHVGLYEHQAGERGIEVTSFLQEFSDVDRAILDGEDDGFVEILTRKGTDRILGATVVASHAGDLVSGITSAMVHGIGLRGIARVIHPYPTQGEAIRRLGDAYNRTRLTPRRKRLLGRFLAWMR